MGERKVKKPRNVVQIVEMGRVGVFTVIGNHSEDLYFRADGNGHGHPVSVALKTPGHEWLLFDGDGEGTIEGLIKFLRAIVKADKDNEDKG